MNLTKYAHACVRIEGPHGTLLLDPSAWSVPANYDGVDAVLITHEHFDHVDPRALSAAVENNPNIRVFTHHAVAALLSDIAGAVSVVDRDETFDAAGFSVTALGGDHADIHDGFPGCANLGFAVRAGAGVIYHPGDSFFVPDIAVDTLLAPISGPWMKLGEAVDFVDSVKPNRVVPIHDALNSKLGNDMAANWLSARGAEYVSLADAQSLELPD